MEVTVSLKNPPSGANKWQIRIIDDVSLETSVWGLNAHDNIDDTAVFELSPDWLFPLSVDIAIYYEWQENGEWHAQQLYRAQSIWPYLWDFDIMDWGYEEDPTYREIFITDLGSYYFNVATEQLEILVSETFHLSVHVPSWAAGGYIDPGSGDYPAYSTVKLTAHPLSGYQFTAWGGDASGTALTYNLYMNSDKNVEAYFEPVVVPEFAGTISKKELEYNESRENIPVY